MSSKTKWTRIDLYVATLARVWAIGGKTHVLANVATEYSLRVHSMEPVRKRSLVGEVAGMEDKFAGRVRKPSVRHFGTQPGGQEVAAHSVL